MAIPWVVLGHWSGRTDLEVTGRSFGGFRGASMAQAPMDGSGGV